MQKSARLSKQSSIRYTIQRAATVVAYLIIILVLPVALTLHSVRTPASLVQNSSNPTPFGYTISLSLFLFPMTALLFWMWCHKNLTIQKPAFLYSLALLIPTGVFLDILFGNTFFIFENHAAVSGITLPGIGGDIPIEEFIFYAAGFTTVLLLYLWCDEYWLAQYNIPDYRPATSNIRSILHFHWPSVIIGLALIVIAIAYKKWLAEDNAGFPWYFIYITSAALIPSIGLYKSVSPFINWRAFSFTFFIIVLISLIWESTLALPYQWWGFQDNAMMGLYIGAWHHLPIEEIVVWFSVSYTTVIIYETVKIMLASGKTFRQLVFNHTSH